MSSISRLSLSQAADESTKLAGWDQTIDDGASWGAKIFRSSISPHAMAHETVVCGTTPTGNTENYITWKTSFSPHRVCRVDSNSNGTVVAATMDNGTVSILRGSDGTNLATRRIAPEGVRVPAEVFFASDEILVIQPPDDGSPIMVSHMDGTRLNDNDQGVVSEATRSMVIHALHFEGAGDIRAIRGFAIEENKVRFALVDRDGKFSVYDYHLEEKKYTIIQSSKSLESDWEIDVDTSLRLQVVGSHFYLVFAAFKGHSTKVCWFDWKDLVVAGEYRLSKNGKKRARLLALEPVVSCSQHDSLAIVLTLKKDGDEFETRVMQASCLNGIIGLPHLVYAIPVPSIVQSIAIAPIVEAGPYSFRCKTWLGEHKHDCHVFCTASENNDGSAIGKIRLLAMQERFDEAQDLFQGFGEALVNDSFARFHPSEIALRRLQLILSTGSISNPESMQQSRDCLQQLVVGSLSGKKHGQQALLSAADSICQWPDENSLQNPPTAREVTIAMEGFISGMSNASNAFQETLSSEFQAKMKQLEEKQVAMKYLESVLDEEVPLNRQFAGVRSLQQLFSCLVQNNFFLVADQMWRSNLRSKITSDTMVSAVLGLSSEVNPRRYASLLKEIVFPNLAINHELLPPLLAWSCKTADTFDDAGQNTNGLDDSIFLLEIVERATKDLRIRIHSSFASYAPFVEKSGAKRRKVISPRNDPIASSTLDLTSTNSRSCWTQKGDEKASDIERTNPTILELSRMTGGAKKAGLRQRTSLRLDGIDESEESIEFKLASARCLKYARSLGLDDQLVSLRTFSRCGGAQYIAKELVSLFSSRASTHKERYDKLSTETRKFCERSGANFDEAMIQYTKELCGGKHTSRKAIEESASIARCCLASKNKCQVTLIALRASLFCHFSPVWLSELSQEAIEWASGDSLLRSELEEASRLLLIDGIVGRYCGEGAKELFHVDNPRHAIRLLEFVTRHIDGESVLSDSLDLCEAFTHLSREDACSRIIENAILQGNEKACSSLMDTLYLQNVVLAKATFSRVLSYCINLIEVGSNNIFQSDVVKESWQHKQVLQATSCGFALTSIALSHFHSGTSVQREGFSCIHFDEARLENLIQDFHRLKVLQTDHSIFLSIAQLHCPNVLVETATRLLDPLVNLYIEGSPVSSSTIATQTKRVCSLLAGTSEIQDVDLWYTAVGSSACRLVWKTKGLECFEFLSDLDVLEACDNNISSRCCLAVALSFCMKASKNVETSELRNRMKNLIMASSLLHDHALLCCSSDLLGTTLSLGDLCDILSQILARSDEGIGEEIDEFRKKLHASAAEKRWSFAFSNKVTRNKIGECLRLYQPSLHATWYIGDGLLLPPSETLKQGVEYCKQAIGVPALSDATLGLHAFVEGRGAHALALRLLCHSTITQICNKRNAVDFDLLADATHETVTALAERYLGGTGNGITSGVVDSQLAVSFLLCLPLKLAFKVYKSSLPTAITTRDFKRVVTLASIGRAAGSGVIFLSDNRKHLGNWKRQEKFVSQCELLALRGKWWGVLQRHNIKFDPHHFDEYRNKPCEQREKRSSKAGGGYVASLLSPLISNLSKIEDDVTSILKTAEDFAVEFGLGRDLAIQRYVEFLLSPLEPVEVEAVMAGSVASTEKGIRTKLSTLEGLVKDLVRRLEPTTNRINVLRNCVVHLEGSDDGKEYERLSVALSLYQDELNSVLARDSEGRELDRQPFLVELELMDRRRDALAILSSYFQGDKREQRPPLSSVFVPLPKTFGGHCSHRLSSGILGSILQPSADYFDPLEPFDKFLSDSSSSAVTSALAPLCLPLGVPRGYMHARSLVARFQKSKLDKAALPSFELDVLLVLQRLKSTSDIADLAEWCSSQYEFGHEDKLRSLDYSLKFALQASNEAERSKNQKVQGDTFTLDAIEANALDRVKRITSAKDLLSDRLAINSILSSVGITSEKSCALSSVVNDLMKRLEDEVWSKSEFTPEHFVEIFYSEASLLASRASLCHQRALSLGQFRQLSALVHQACKSISDKYSHVHTGHIARRLARRWLFHGDQLSSGNETIDMPASRDSAVNQLLAEIEEDDTVNFVMDLASLRDEHNTWSTDIGSGPLSSRNQMKVTSEEEPSSLSATSSREASELESRRASLRIAFVMAYADGYHSSGNGDENTKPAANNLNASRYSKTKNRGLLAKVSNRGKKQEQATVFEHCRELLRIVFAQSGGAGSLITKDLNSSIDSRGIGGKTCARKTITFAMRHRALRSCSILCPQDALEEVLREDEFVNISSPCLLRKCSFASFVAKEIEEMGLPIPHSDFAQLSTMHFPSYARALWRHHRDDKKSKGRLLLLIFEMYLKESISDYEFFGSLLAEMESLNLPRTMLLAFESVSFHVGKLGPTMISSFMEAVGQRLERTFCSLSNIVFSELRKLSCPETATLNKQEAEDALETLRRLGRIVESFSCTSNGQGILVSFIQAIMNLVESLSSLDFAKEVNSITQNLLRRVNDRETSKTLMEKFAKVGLDHNSGGQWMPLYYSEGNTSAINQKEDMLSGSLGRLETSLDNTY